MPRLKLLEELYRSNLFDRAVLRLTPTEALQSRILYLDDTLIWVVCKTKNIKWWPTRWSPQSTGCRQGSTGSAFPFLSFGHHLVNQIFTSIKRLSKKFVAIESRMLEQKFLECRAWNCYKKIEPHDGTEKKLQAAQKNQEQIGLIVPGLIGLGWEAALEAVT